MINNSNWFSFLVSFSYFSFPCSKSIKRREGRKHSIRATVASRRPMSNRMTQWRTNREWRDATVQCQPVEGRDFVLARVLGALKKVDKWTLGKKRGSTGLVSERWGRSSVDSTIPSRINFSQRSWTWMKQQRRGEVSWREVSVWFQLFVRCRLSYVVILVLGPRV